MSELSRSQTADIADTRFAAAIREAGRLAVRAMSGYGMAACGAKRPFVVWDELASEGYAVARLWNTSATRRT
jgi:hypothetical protein